MQRRNLAIPSRWYTLHEAIDTLRKRRNRFDHWTFQASFHLNVDPRSVQGHDGLHGCVELPHPLLGDATTRSVLALTQDETLAQAALDVGGAQDAGDLLTELKARQLLLKDYDVIVATDNDMKKLLTINSANKRAKLPRLLKQFNLTPTVHHKTLVKPEQFVHTVQRYVEYRMLQWKADLHGNVTVPLGKVLLGTDHIVDNFDAILAELYTYRPHNFGDGPRGRPKNKGKYLLGAVLKMTEGPALPLDLSTVVSSEHCGRGAPPYYTPNGMPYGVDFCAPNAQGDHPPLPRVPLQPNGHPVEPIVIHQTTTTTTTSGRYTGRSARTSSHSNNQKRRTGSY